jgi:hypothetical protein
MGQADKIEKGLEVIIKNSNKFRIGVEKWGSIGRGKFLQSYTSGHAGDSVISQSGI